MRSAHRVEQDYRTCIHVAERTLFDHEGKDIRIASARGLARMSISPHCIIDLAGVIGNIDFILPGSDPLFDALRVHVHRPLLLRLAWEDMGIPPVGLDFWKHLWELLPKGVTVIVCYAGHGRSGTALAALLIANGVHPEDAIQYVRGAHCQFAIETPEQEEYLLRLVP